MRNKVLTIIALLGIAVGSIQAAETTVTYKMTATFTYFGSREQADITFVRFGDKLSGPTGEKTATIENMAKCTFFSANLDDGLTFQLVMSEGLVDMEESDGYSSIALNYRGNNNTYILIGSANYFIKHIKLADARGYAINGIAPPFFASATGLDVDVDLVKKTDGGGMMASFNANVTSYAILGEITVTYADAPREYSINYHNAVNDENGVTNTNFTSYTVETTGFDITAPSRKGYDFEGFYRNAAMTGSPYTLPITIRQASVIDTKNLDLYAKWTAHTYTVSFNGNGAEGNMEDMAFTYDQAQDLTANNFSKTGYHFTGWNTASNGSGDSYDDEAEILNLTDVNGAVIDLYAQWKANTYAVRLNSNEGSGEIVVLVFTYDDAQALSTNLFSKTGYHIDRWTTASDGTGTSYTYGQEVGNLTAENGAVIDLYAQWEINTYTVRFNKNYGSNDYVDQAFTYDEEKALTANTFTRDQATFVGWNTASDGSGTSYTDGQKVSNLSDEHGAVIDLYAQWECDPITYIDAQGNEATCTQYEIIPDGANGTWGKDGEENWYTFKGSGSIGNINFNGNTHIILDKDKNAMSWKYHITANGNLDIYSQEGGKGYISQGTNCEVYVNGDFSIHGGSVTLTTVNAKSVNIGWSDATDNILLSNIGSSKATIQDGQYVKGIHETCISGKVEVEYIRKKTIKPALPMREDAANSSLIASYSNKRAGIGLIGRTIYNDGTWNTICLPNSAGSGIGTNPITNSHTIMELDTEGKYNDAGEEDEGGTHQTGIEDGILYLYFKTVDKIEPGKPYIIKYNGASGGNIVDPFFGDTNIADLSTYTGSDAEKCQAYLEANAATSGDGSVRFIGQFDPFPIDDSNRYKTIMLGPDNTLGFTSANTLHPCRAHFEILGANNIKGYQIGFGEGGTTGIIPIKAEPAAQGIYTLDGLRIEGRPTKKGVYIKDGKKVMIND